MPARRRRTQHYIFARRAEVIESALYFPASLASCPSGPKATLHPRGLLVLQDGVVLTDFRGEAQVCLPSPAQRAG
jgi:hypothetical protein